MNWRSPRRYRKKPVKVEALQLLAGMDHADVLAFVGESLVQDGNDVLIRTLEGDMRVSIGDYVIKGVQGEFYPCKPDIFEATYEPVKYQCGATGPDGSSCDLTEGHLDRRIPHSSRTAGSWTS